MTRRLLAAGCVVLCLVSTAWSQPSKAAPPATADKAEKPTISVVLVSIDELYRDLKLVFDIAGDPKGFKTLKETIEVFLEGVETNKAAGVRVYMTADGLRAVASLPIKNEADLKTFLQNLWDLDVKSSPAPDNKLEPQVPRAVQQKRRQMMLQPTERILFGLYDAFLKYESGHVHLGELLTDVRLAKGGVPAETAKDADLAILIDGGSKTPEERRKAFEKAKAEVLAIEKKENEQTADFELRKSITEHEVAEIERFFAESSKIQLTWLTSPEKKHARLDLGLSAVKDTPLAKSIEMIGETADEFAGVGKQNCALALQINFPLDEMRQAALKPISKQARDRLKSKVDEDEKVPAAQKAVDKDLVDLVFDVIDEIGGMGVFNGCLRTWSNGDGTLTTVGATKVLNGAKFVNLLQKFAGRGGENAAEMKVETIGDVEIHKITVADLQKDYPEVFTKDGSIYVGTAEKAVWYAFGEKALDRLKVAIEEAKAGAKPGQVVELNAKLLPLVEVYDKIRARKNWKVGAVERRVTPKDKATESQKKADGEKKKPGDLLSDLDLVSVAKEAFREGQDTVSLSLGRKPNQDEIEAAIQFDEGILRFVGKALSKFVKDNLGD